DTAGSSPTDKGSSSSATPSLPPLLGSQKSVSAPSDGQNFCFVAFPDIALGKRPRRPYKEIERLYNCSWPECDKAYGTLGHLNAHVRIQGHGAKRRPNEFKELRKRCRKVSKD
ncbi:hypothetical protein DFH07DRAFT_685170, partial [Mycena maculata]